MWGRPVIDHRSDHSFALAPEELWEAIEDVGSFEERWSWLQNFSFDGDGLEPGSVLHGVVAPPLPYRMRIDVEFTRCERPRLIDARVAGDLRGSSHLRLRQAEGGTNVEVSWSVEMMQGPMRLASRFAYPLLCWGHDRVVEMTVSSFRSHVEPG